MKKALNGSWYLVILLVSMFAYSCREKQPKPDLKVQYTCPMHPQITEDQPGSCPICGMDLVSKSRPHSSEERVVNDSLGQLLKPVNEVVISNIKTVKPQSGLRFAELQISGRINYNTANFHTIFSRVSGRIEKLYVKYNYQQVRKGQKLMEIYSPDLVNAQQELLFLKRSQESRLLEAAKSKLRVLGASDGQIRLILETEKVQDRFTVFSPFSGFVAVQALGSVSSSTTGAIAGATVISSEGGGDGMSPMSGASPAANPSLPQVAGNGPLSVTEGQYVTAGQKIFDLVNASTVWAEFFVAPEQLKYFKRGTAVHVSSENASSPGISAVVKLIQPYYSEGVQFSLARAVLNNATGNWKIGQLINVKAGSARRNGTWVPREAVLQLGIKQVAFIKHAGAFKPVYVKVIGRAGEWLDIGDSLPADTELAENAWFLVDTESFIKPERIEP